MRTLILYLFSLGLVGANAAFAMGGQIEISKHRFSRHTEQHFERLVLEFKNHTGQGLPSVRIATDATAGEVAKARVTTTSERSRRRAALGMASSLGK